MPKSRQPRKGRKVRVDFQKNRGKPGRESDWTRRYHGSNEQLGDELKGESVRTKGELSRKRTVIHGDDDTSAIDHALWLPGTVTVVHGQTCHVTDHALRQWDCTVRRVLRTLLIDQRAPVTVGDRVWFAPGKSSGDQPVGVIEKIEPRTTTLSRRESRENRGREQIVVANADQLLIVASVAQPRFRPHLIDRYIIAGIKGKLRPVICFTKADLLDDAEAADAADSRDAIYSRGDSESDDAINPDDAIGADVAIEDRITARQLLAEYRQLGYDCLLTSTATGLGLDEFKDRLKGRITVLSGQSGVGKSSLVNAIQPGMNLKVMTVSSSSEKGRHATTFARLIPLNFGALPPPAPDGSRKPTQHAPTELGVARSGTPGRGVPNPSQPPTSGVTPPGTPGRGAAHPPTSNPDSPLPLPTPASSAQPQTPNPPPPTSFVVDTPGIRQFDLWNVGPGELEAYFVEFVPYLQKCRFPDCLHDNSDGCAVRAAAESGQISFRRYMSYTKMLEELMSGGD